MLTPTEEGLLRAMCESPLDALPRLIYADWLDEQDWRGDPRYKRNIPPVALFTRELRARAGRTAEAHPPQVGTKWWLARVAGGMPLPATPGAKGKERFVLTDSCQGLPSGFSWGWPSWNKLVLRGRLFARVPVIHCEWPRGYTRCEYYCCEYRHGLFETYYANRRHPECLASGRQAVIVSGVLERALGGQRISIEHRGGDVVSDALVRAGRLAAGLSPRWE